MSKYFDRMTKISRFIVLFGMLASAIGICIGSKTIITTGCVALFLAAYVMAFVVAKSF